MPFVAITASAAQGFFSGLYCAFWLVLYELFSLVSAQDEQAGQCGGEGCEAETCAETDDERVVVSIG